MGAVRGLNKRLVQRVPTEGHRKPQRLQRLRELGVLQMGTGSYGEPEVLVWWDDAGRPIGGKVRVGNYVSIAGQVQIFTGGNHVKERVTTYPVRQIYGLAAHGEDEHPQSNGDVVIGSDVWIAQSAIVLSGVTIGDGAIVGSGAVVVKDVRPYSIVVGNPAREVARRFDDATVDELVSF